MQRTEFAKEKKYAGKFLQRNKIEEKEGKKEGRKEGRS